MRIVSEKNIARTSFLYAILVVGIVTFSTGGLFIFNKFKALNKDLKEIENNFVLDKKNQLKADVDALISRIETSKAGFRIVLEEQLAQRVNEAIGIADNIHSSLSSSLGKEQTADIIKEALRPIRFNNNQSYYFIITFDGDAVLHPTDIEIEGQNLLLSPDGKTSRTAKKIIELITSQKEGFTHYSWTRPGDTSGRDYPKISYAAVFEPYNWIIGTGEYIVNLETLARETITKDLRNNLQSSIHDYFFVYKLHDIKGGKEFATMLINSNRKDLVGKRISDDYVDARGKPFRKEFLKGIREKGEAYVVYWYKKPDGSGIGRKLSYFKHYKEWDWVVARGIYFDRIDAIISANKSSLRTRVKNDILLLCMIFVFAVSVALTVAFHFSKELESIFSRYKNTQKEHTEKLEDLNKSLKQLSRTDALTGIFNRGYFNYKLSVETARATRYKSPLCAILYDIDHFKSINDTFGHLVGDEVLKDLTDLVRINIRKTDIAARWGGEEFAILAPGIHLEEALLFAEKLRKIIEDCSFTIDRQITCSFGVTLFKPPESSDSMLARLDQNLYAAKEQGRNRCIAN